MRIATQLIAVFALLVLMGAGASAYVHANLTDARTHQQAAIARASEAYGTTAELASLAEREATVLLALSAGASDTEDIDALRAQFAQRYAEARASSPLGHDDLRHIHDRLAELEAGLFEGDDAHSLHVLVEHAANGRSEILASASDRRQELERAVAADPADALALTKLRLGVERERSAVSEIAQTLAMGASGSAVTTGILRLNLDNLDATRGVAASILARIEGEEAARLHAELLAGSAFDAPDTTRALFGRIAALEGAEEELGALVPLGRVLASGQSIRPTLEAHTGTLLLLQERTRASLGPRAAELTSLAAEARAHGAEDLATAVEDGNAAVANAERTTLLVLVGVLVPTTLIGAGIVQRIRRRTHAFDDAARAVSTGRFDLPAPPRQNDEFDALADAWDGMTKALAERERDLATRTAVLHQGERMATLGSLLAGVAHEVNNPLAFVKSNEELSLMDLEMLAASPAIQNEPALARIVDDVRTSIRANVDGIQRIERINRALKGFASPARDDRELLDLNDVIEGVLIIAHNRLKSRFRIERDYGTVPGFMGSPQEIGQVVLNLVINAAEASPEGGTIRIRTRAADGEACVTVADDGPGIPQEVRAKLFAPFATTKKHGTGLGLSISQGIARSHGGSLSLDDTDRGASFTLALPLRPAGVAA